MVSRGFTARVKEDWTLTVTPVPEGATTQTFQFFPLPILPHIYHFSAPPL